jgi:hypothetical protein
MSPDVFWILGAVQSVLLAPFLAIVIAFGEEYRRRGYLQSELFKLGRVRGVMVLGVIWGAWHWPLILMGYNYPGHPLLGMVLMALYTTGLAVVLGYAVLRSGSVLLAAYLPRLVTDSARRCGSAPRARLRRYPQAEPRWSGSRYSAARWRTDSGEQHVFLGEAAYSDGDDVQNALIEQNSKPMPRVGQLHQLQQDKLIITFVYAAHDTEHNSALVLKGFLEEYPQL